MKSENPKQKLAVQLLEVDMSGKGTVDCAACNSTEAMVQAALQALKPVFDEVNCEVKYDKIVVRSMDEATARKFLGSPTIRVGKLDFFPQHGPNLNEDRFWTWRSQILKTLSKPIVMEVILKGFTDSFADLRTTEISDYVSHYLKAPKEPSVSQGCCS